MSPGGFEDLTDGEVERQTDLELHWQERLEEPQRERAARLQERGLTGRLGIGDGFRFAWLRGDEVVAESQYQQHFADAFEEATGRLPAKDHG